MIYAYNAGYCSRILLLKDGVVVDEMEKEKGRETFYQAIVGRMGEL